MAEASNHTQPDKLTVILRWVVGSILGIAVLVGGWFTYAWFSTPASIRVPQQAHYHFRMLMIFEGRPVSFADGAFQTEFNKDMCTAAITKEPFHFHDGTDQFVHAHWAHLTGAILLKNFGWNFLGATPKTLGYRFDSFPAVKRVPIHGAALPRRDTGLKYYVYTSSVTDPLNYRERSWNDFLGQDLEKFFAGSAKTSWLDRIVPAAEAHEDENVEATSNASQDPATVVERAELNHVLGNVIIFAQPNPPTDAQIKDRLNRLVPLPESSCAG